MCYVNYDCRSCVTTRMKICIMDTSSMALHLIIAILILSIPAVFAKITNTSLRPCTLLDTNNHVRDGASYSWTLTNLAVDTAPPASSSTDPIVPRNVSFTVSSPDISPPVHCSGARAAPEDNVWHECHVGSSEANTWLTFSSDFLINNYVELNQTWACQTTKGNRATMQATGGESLGWFVCGNDSKTAVLEAVPGHCEHVQPLLSADEQLNGAVTTKNWTEMTGDFIVAASINVVDFS